LIPDDVIRTFTAEPKMFDTNARGFRRSFNCVDDSFAKVMKSFVALRVGASINHRHLLPERVLGTMPFGSPDSLIPVEVKVLADRPVFKPMNLNDCHVRLFGESFPCFVAGGCAIQVAAVASRD
jgi:hypothetical protein